MDTDASHGETEIVSTNDTGVVGVCLRVCSVEVKNGKHMALLRHFALERWDGMAMRMLREEQQWAIVAEGHRLFTGVFSKRAKVFRYAIPENAQMAGRSFEEVYNEKRAFELVEGSNIGDEAHALVTVIVHSGPDAQQDIGIALCHVQRESDYQGIPNVNASYYKGCYKVLISAHREQLAELYESCKDKPFELVGSGYKIVAVVPAFRVQDDCFLPIVHEEADNSKVPCWVHRNQGDVTYLIPVVNGGSPTVAGIHDNKWFVQEDIVHVPSNDGVKIDTLAQQGYLQLATQNDDEVDGDFVFGLHVLR
jgi:hypothetical protein